MYREDEQKIISSGVLQGLEADAKRRQAQQEANLRQLLLGQNVERAKALASEQGLKPGSFNVSASESGFNVNPGGSDMLELMRMQNLQDEREQRRVERGAQALDRAQMPAKVADVVAAEQATKADGGGIITNPEYKVKSAGLNRWLPAGLQQPALKAGEALGLSEQGAAAEHQAIQRLMNMDIRNLSGTAVSHYEEGRTMAGMGLKQGDPEAIRRGVKTMTDALARETDVLKAGMGSAAEKLPEFDYRKILGAQAAPAAQPAATDSRRARLEELRAKYKK